MRERSVKVIASVALAPFAAACTVPVTSIVVDDGYPASPTRPRVVYGASWEASSFLVPIPPGSSSAPKADATNPPACPATYAQLQAENACTASELRCEYSGEAVCECAGNLAGNQPDQGLLWYCNPAVTVPASTSTAYVVLAPGWNADTPTPPTSFVVLESRTGFSVELGDTLEIQVDDTTFRGNCASGSLLPQSRADFITQFVFPSIFAKLRYDAATCTTTPAGDAGGP